jgi:hypothetical protein
MRQLLQLDICMVSLSSISTANLFYRGHAHDTKDTKEFFVIRR